jgi:hypothetical protein
MMYVSTNTHGTGIRSTSWNGFLVLVFLDVLMSQYTPQTRPNDSAQAGRAKDVRYGTKR